MYVKQATVNALDKKKIQKKKDKNIEKGVYYGICPLRKEKTRNVRMWLWWNDLDEGVNIKSPRTPGSLKIFRRVFSDSVRVSRQEGI